MLNDLSLSLFVQHEHGVLRRMAQASAFWMLTLFTRDNIATPTCKFKVTLLRQTEGRLKYYLSKPNVFNGDFQARCYLIRANHNNGQHHRVAVREINRYFRSKKSLSMNVKIHKCHNSYLIAKISPFTWQDNHFCVQEDPTCIMTEVSLSVYIYYHRKPCELKVSRADNIVFFLTE